MAPEVTSGLLLALLLCACSSSTASSSSSGDVTPVGSESSAAELCVTTINTYRTQAGLPAFAAWTDNESCTDTQAASDGATKAAHGAFGQCGEFAQNECPGWPAPAENMIGSCLKAMMDEGPGGGHYDSIMSTKYTMVSCGFAQAGDGSIWAVQNFR